MSSPAMNFQPYPLGFVARNKRGLFVDGDWIESKDLSDDGIKYLTSGNVGVGEFKEQGAGFISEETFLQLRCTEVMPGDVLISRLNLPVGRACSVPDLGHRLVTCVDNVIVRPSDDFDRRFLVYVLSTPNYLENTSNLARGTTMQRISRSVLGRIRLLLPDLPNQQRIADFLDRETARIDALIAKKERLGDVIEQRRLAMITAAVAGQIGPAAEAKSADGAPKRGVRLRYMLQVAPSAREIKNLIDDDVVTFAPMDALVDGLGGLNTSLSRPLGEVAAGSYNYFREGDVLLAKVTPCFENGKKALAANLTNGVGFATSEVHVFRANPKKLDARFLMYLFSSEDFRAEGMKSMTGAGGLKRVSDTAILNYRPHVVDVDLQRSVADFLDREMAVFEVIKNRTRASIDRLREYRAAMITAAVTGQIDVDAARAKETVSAGLDRLQEAAEA